MRVNIYIRKGDEDRWKSIKDIPEFIHNALQKSHNPAQKADLEELMSLPGILNPKPKKWSGPIYKKSGKL